MYFPVKHFFVIFFISAVANATIFLGTGFNSATSGRLVPALNAGYAGQTLELQLSSTGVATTAYYHSSYRMSLYKTWKAGDFLFGTTESGFGAGALYGVRGYKETETVTETKSDYVVGPTFFVRWMLWGPMYISVDGLYGIIGPSSRNGDLIGLNARDNVNFVIGFKL